MKLAENMLFKYGSGKVIRVLFINPITSIIYVIDMDSNRWSYPIPKEDFLTAYQNKEIIYEEDNYSRVVPEEELNEIEKKKRDHAWEMITFLKKKLANEEHIFISNYRQKAMKETMEFFGISYNGVKNILIKYFKGGRTKSGLLPNYFKCGGRGKERKVGEKKRGRPRLNNQSDGVNIDDNIKRIFKKGLNKYYYNEKQRSLKITYELILRDFFSNDVVEKGIKIKVLQDSNSLPTYQQFLYWFRKSLNDEKKEIIKRKGTRVYQQNYRTIIGDSTQDAGLGPGTLFQIDSTMFDAYLVSSFNRDIIVGRPILFLIVDVYSRAIVGFNVSFESLNSYVGAMCALANSMLSKKELCKKYGIEILDKDFPFCVPQRILADRGELVGKQIENAIENLGITIQQTSAYHADLKGIIEQAFNQTNLKVLPFVDGAVIGGKSQKERGEKDYRLKANLTIDDFIKIILKCILFHNRNHVLSNYLLDESMMEENIEKIPLKIWEHGLKHKKGQLRILQEDVIKTYLLPTATASVTPRGLAFKKMLYASEFALKNNWFQRARINGSWKVKVSYNPSDVSILYVFDENSLHKFSLLEHLSLYAEKSLEEITRIKEFEEQEINKSKEKELQEKIQLFSEIEEIVKEAKEKTESERDQSKSKTQRIKGIKENQKEERLLQREKMNNEENTINLNDKPEEETVDEDYKDDFDLFRKAKTGRSWGRIDG